MYKTSDTPPISFLVNILSVTKECNYPTIIWKVNRLLSIISATRNSTASFLGPFANSVETKR